MDQQPHQQGILIVNCIILYPYIKSIIAILSKSKLSLIHLMYNACSYYGDLGLEKRGFGWHKDGTNLEGNESNMAASSSRFIPVMLT